MKKQAVTGAVLLSGVVMLLVLWALFGGSPSPNAASAAVPSDVPRRTDGTPIPLTSSNLLGKSLAEIDQITLRTAQLEQKVGSGSPQVLLTRPVKPADLPALGLVCMPSGYTYEEPPYVLVILRGDFQLALMTGPADRALFGVRLGSLGGDACPYRMVVGWANFRIALNDPSLPQRSSPMTISCPAYTGAKLHYGDTPPTCPPGTPAPFATDAPPPTPRAGPSPVPTPVPTQAAPLP